MKYKLEVEAESYEDFIKKARKALKKVSNETEFKSLMSLRINIWHFSFNYGEFSISRSKDE